MPTIRLQDNVRSNFHHLQPHTTNFYSKPFMNTAAMILKKIDLLSFISRSETPGASLRMTAANDGSHSSLISFPACGNWTNKPLSMATRRQYAAAMFRSAAAR